MTVHVRPLLTKAQLTAAALAAMLREPEWARGLADISDAQVESITPSYVQLVQDRNKYPNYESERRAHRGVAFMLWLARELERPTLDPQDIRDLLLTIRQAYEP